MPTQQEDVNGSFPDLSAVALVLIDWINDLEFDGGDELLTFALPAAERTAALKRRARAAGIPVIYVNDNFGQWRSDFRSLVGHVQQDGVRGRPLAELLAPGEDDYFVLKPKHSAFFETTFDTLLRHLGVETLILTGVAGDICVLFTASDAYMRDYKLFIPSDCVASLSERDNSRVLAYMKRVLDADTRSSSQLDFSATELLTE